MDQLKNAAPPFWEQPESRRLEFKEEFPQGDQIAKTVVAFANGAGGKIVLGVRDNPRQITGIPDDQLFALEEQISNYIADSCAPTVVPEVYIQSVDGKNLLVVEVFPGSHKPYYLKAKGNTRELAFGLDQPISRLHRRFSKNWKDSGARSLLMLCPCTM